MGEEINVFIPGRKNITIRAFDELISQNVSLKDCTVRTWFPSIKFDYGIFI